MSKALSLDLRTRVLAAIAGGPLVQAGRAALWGERVKRDPLARVGAPAGGRAAEGARR